VTAEGLQRPFFKASRGFASLKTAKNRLKTGLNRQKARFSTAFSTGVEIFGKRPKVHAFLGVVSYRESYGEGRKL
jgi:hypothetical protein